MKRIRSLFFDQGIPLKFGKFHFLISTGMILTWLLTVISVFLFLQFVQLKPKIGENFFFSSEDPQLRQDRTIQELFKQEPQLLLGVQGYVRSERYLEKLKQLTEELAGVENVIGVHSMATAVGSFEAAVSSPLWSRMLVSNDHESTFVHIFIRDVNTESFIPKIEKIVEKYDAPNFRIMISGAPYITESLRRKLFDDLKTFTVAAFAIFGVLMLLIFRSLPILAGTLISCVNASALTLLIAQFAGIETGPLTANLSTIVFVLTLTHIVFMTFNFRHLVTGKDFEGDQNASVEAAKLTLHASFWSMLTTFLGFLSLLLVKATPLQQLGAAGALGTVVAFILAYLVYPFYLSSARESQSGEGKLTAYERKIEPYFYRKHHVFFIFLFVAVIAVTGGIFKVNTDPSLFAYFKEDSEIRRGLEYIDENGGSSPLFLVVHDPNHVKFNTEKGLVDLWFLSKALEEHREVGSVVALPHVMAEARMNFFARFISMEWLIDLLDTEMFGKVAQYFITPDRKKALIMLRMKETGREEKRMQIIGELERIVEKHNLWPLLIGGVYSLQGRMSQLVTSSLISGLLLLVGMFVCMGWFLSGSFLIAVAMLFSLVLIPVGILGLMGYIGMPLDVIAAPAANISIAMGVDSMIHMLIFAKRNNPEKIKSWVAWKKACVRMWKPVIYASLVIGSGFGIFSLSYFPPTQRFGLMVVTGAVLAPLAALIAFPFLNSAVSKLNLRPLKK